MQAVGYAWSATDTCPTAMYTPSTSMRGTVVKNGILTLFGAVSACAGVLLPCQCPRQPCHCSSRIMIVFDPDENDSETYMVLNSKAHSVLYGHTETDVAPVCCPAVVGPALVVNIRDVPVEFFRCRLRLITNTNCMVPP